MKKVIGKNVKINKDNSGGLISVDWVCPHCRAENFGFYFTSLVSEIQGDFELDHECDECGETVTIICRNADELF